MKQQFLLAVSVITAFALCMVFAPAAARAAGQPVVGPKAVFTETFEGATAPSRLTLDWEPSYDEFGAPIPVPYWGRVTATGRSFSPTHGLWCAGTISTASWTSTSAATTAGWTSPSGWTDYVGLYPSFTAGLASFHLPELGDYYSSVLSYRYLMPSIGTEDSSAFMVRWRGDGGNLWDLHSSQPIASSWTAVSYPLSAPSTGDHSVNLSRTGGEVVFQFVAADTGEGPTIDDVSVTGYKYGPVRALRAASATPAGVSLTWTKPARSTAVGAADETRSIAYRVWRSPDVQPYSWTELTVARVTGTSFEDAAPVGGRSRYIVQAWDPDTGVGYGEVETSAGVSVFVNKAPESTIVLNPAVPGVDGLYVVAPIVNVSRDIDGLTYWRWDSGESGSTAAASFQVPVPISPATTRTLDVYSANSLGAAETPHKTVTFAMRTYRLDYVAGAGGAITGAAVQVLNYGGNGTRVTATPSAGYHFVAWSDGVATAARSDGAVMADLLVSASFAINTYRLQYAAGEGGTISGAAAQTASYDSTGTAVTADSAAGWHFVAWSDGVTTVERTDQGVRADLLVTAVFAINTYRLHYAADIGGTIGGITSQTVSYGGNGTAVMATPAAGYSFVAWSDGTTVAVRTDSGIAGDVTVTASFALVAAPTRMLTYTAGVGGSIVGVTPQTVSVGDSGIQVTAAPSVGYHFVKWSDGLATATRTEHGVQFNALFSAAFALDIYQLSYAADTGGTVSGTAGQMVTYNGSGTTVTAVPATGYHFIGWSDGVTTAARAEGSVVSAITVTAFFAPGLADTAPPVTTWTGRVTTYVTKATIVLNAVDAYDPIVASTHYKLDTGPETTYKQAFSTTKTGAHTLWFWSVDRAGNVEEAKHVHFTVLVATYVSITSNHTTVTHKHPVVFSGHISSSQPRNTHVKVYVKKPGSHTWVYLSTRYITSTHHWSYTYAPAYKGTWYFQVRFAATTKYGASHSPDRKITVR